MAGLRPSANKSTRRHQRSPRHRVTTNVARCKSSTLHRNPRPHVERPRRRRRQPREHVARRQMPHCPRTLNNNNNITRLRLLLLLLLLFPCNSVPCANLSGQRPITTVSPMSPFLQPGLPLEVRLVLPGSRPEETRTGSHPSQQWLQPTPRGASPNPRESNTRFHHPSSQKLPYPVSRALDFQAHIVDIQSNSDHLVLDPAQRATSARIRLPRRWDA